MEHKAVEDVLRERPDKKAKNDIRQKQAPGQPIS